MVGRASRSPANFLGFSKFADSGGFSDLWQPLVGPLIAAVAVSVLGAIAFGSSRKHPMRAVVGAHLSRGRAGCPVFGADSDLGRNGVGALSYALLVFCLIYAYDAGRSSTTRGPCRRCNAGHRVGGARIVAAADSGVIVAFVVCGILAVANVLTGHHFGTRRVPSGGGGAPRRCQTGRIGSRVRGRAHHRCGGGRGRRRGAALGRRAAARPCSSPHCHSINY